MRGAPENLVREPRLLQREDETGVWPELSALEERHQRREPCRGHLHKEERGSNARSRSWGEWGNDRDEDTPPVLTGERE